MIVVLSALSEANSKNLFPERDTSKTEPMIEKVLAHAQVLTYFVLSPCNLGGCVCIQIHVEIDIDIY